MDSIIEPISTENVHDFRKKILTWYDKHKRVLPWRALPGEFSDPYHIWMSEIMLQQTTVQAVIPYFLKFIERWPDVHSLAHADVDDVMAYWAGLGYYARARNLLKCARLISQKYGGVFPQDYKVLISLPGVGDYTAAAICSIAFDQPSVVVDGNIERVMARLNTVLDPLPAGKRILKAYAAKYSDGYKDRPGDYAQALMDLGATICTPKSPICPLCPVNDVCKAYARGEASLFPIRDKKAPKPKRFGYVYIIENNQQLLLHKRPEEGLLGGMYGLPTTCWVDDESKLLHIDILDEGTMVLTKRYIKHVFTHFELRLDLVYGRVSMEFGTDDRYVWFSRGELSRIGLPTVFKKVFMMSDKQA